MRVLAVQPPFVQLNAPYPAVHYLAAWLRARDIETRVEDHSIELWRSLFSRAGLARLFDEVEARLARGGLPVEGAEEVERYLSYRRLYEEWIDPVVDFLSGADPAFSHRLAGAVEFPRGARVEAFLDGRDRRPGTEDAARVASLLLEDLGDLVVHAVDPDFGTVHYGERLGRSRDDFGEVRAALADSWLMREFYRPLLRARFASLTGNAVAGDGSAPGLLLLSLPFPGTLMGALACASEARDAFGAGLRIAFGGGYVSTELRGLRDPGLFDFCDFLCFDAGYGGLASILEDPGGGSTYFRTMTRREGRIVSAGFSEGDLAADPGGCAGGASPLPERLVIPASGLPDGAERRWRAVEDEALRNSHPDWRDFDPSRYLRPLDSTNPMHRLWSESPWLKYRLAQGCYWKRCAFCDTQLEYVSSFVQAGLQPLLAAMDRASEVTGLRGIHFVDEALPMGRLLAFAEANRARAAAGKKSYHYWGNIRFDPSWTADRAELLAASGLVAVSGGIEIASEEGLAMTDKGFDLAGLVASLVALRRAGVLVHAYLIHGFPGQDEASIVEAAEFVRGLFATGLVDSAFWHRFVLTRHSRMMAEWKQGRRPGLVPRDRGGVFAANDLEFEGEEAYEGYGEILDAALGAWMEGEALDRPASSWFGAAPLQGGGPERGGQGSRQRRRAAERALAAAAGVRPDGVALVEELIAKAEAALENRRLPASGTVHWVAGLPRVNLPGASPGRIAWARRGELEDIQLGDAGRARQVSAAIGDLALKPDGLDLASFRRESGLADHEIQGLRDLGLVLVD